MEGSTFSEKMHRRLLAMLKELHRICVENDITYYIACGTALGARRHRGFIPWDDDVDIAMPRPDFERLAALPQDRFPSFLELRWYRNTENSPFRFIKVVDNRTTLKEAGYGDYIEGIYIDIFPLDGARPDSFWEKLRRKKTRTLYLMVMTKCSSIRKSTAFKRLAAKFVKLLSLDMLSGLLEKALMDPLYESCPMVADYVGAWGERETMDKRVLGKPTLYAFEDTELYGPEHMDEYLTNLYGDFMVPPPVEQQVFRHNYLFLDFDTPFREYKEDRK